MTYVLFNPLAGHDKMEEVIAPLVDSLGQDVRALDIREINDYAALLGDLGEQDSLIICGGDGTLNRFINETEGISVNCQVLYVAAGSGNDFLRDIEADADGQPVCINKYIEKLPQVQVKGKTYRFLNNVGFGIDGYCCEVGDKLKAAGKKVDYTGIAIKGLLFHYTPTNAVVTVDGQQFKYKKVWLSPTMKGRYYGGGMMAAPEQDRLDPDGKLSVMLFYGKGRLSTLIAFPSIFKGEHVKKTNMVAIHSGKEIEVTFDRPAPVQIDGETIIGVTGYRATASVKVEA